MNATKILAAMLFVVSTLAVPAFGAGPLSEGSKAEQIERKRVASEQIAQARARFWETYPDKPGADEAQRRFEELLQEKDAFYFQKALWGIFADVTSEVDVDGGIRESARPEFNDWVKAARDSGAPQTPFAPGQLMDPVTAARTINAWEYKRYVRERNWSEFDAMHRLPSGFDKPETYGGYLYFRYKFARLPKDDPRAKSPSENAAATFEKMVEVLGKQLVYDSVKKIMDAPKSAKGNLPITVPRPVKKGPSGDEVEDNDVPMPDGVIGVYASPLTALEMLVIKDDDRRYLLWLLSGLDPSKINTNGMDATTEWAFAESLYHRLVLAFGEKDVLEAAHVVRTAKKRMTSYTVMDPKAIGATRNGPWTAYEDILARKNLRGYLRSTLMFTYNANLKTPAEVDAAHKKFVSENEEDTVLEAAKQLAAAQPNLTSAGELAMLKNVLNGSLTFKKPPPSETLVDFPQYVMWKRFNPGTKISYATRYWKQDRLSTQMPVRSNRLIPEMQYHEAYQLQSINSEEAKLWFSQSSYDMFGHAKPGNDREVAYPAKYTPPAQQLPSANEPTPTSNAAWGAKRTAAPVETGDEVLEIDGKRIATRWQSVSYGYDPNGTNKDCILVVKVWTSDEVPTGLIRRVEDKSCPPGPGSPYGIRFVSETFLESFDGFTPATPDPSKPVASAYAPQPVAPSQADTTSKATAAFSPAAFSQRYIAINTRAARADGQLARKGRPLPAGITDARAKVDAQLHAAQVAFQNQNTSEAEQNLQFAEHSLSVIEQYVNP